MEKAYLLCESDESCLQWWDHEKNSEELFFNVRRRARIFVYWRCPSCNYSFISRVDSVTSPYYPKCNKCGNTGKDAFDEKRTIHLAEISRYKHMFVSEVPQLLDAWADDRDPSKITVIPQFSSGQHDDIVFRFMCKKGHHSKMSPYTYLQNGCPFCSALLSKEKGSYTIDPQQPELVAEWDYEKNGKNTPKNTSINSKKRIAWRCLNCGFTWEESPKERLRSYSSCCPNCKKPLGSIGWRFPNLAKEWSPNNSDTPWRIRSSVVLGYIPEWICENDPSHIWRATIQTRIKGQNCPFCNHSTSSKTEKKYFEIAKEYFEDVQSSCTLYEDSFSHEWEVDILIKYKGKKIVIEYDGAFWHKKKLDVDMQKSLELIREGYIVIRLREIELQSLPIIDPNYKEYIVHPLTIKQKDVMKNIKEYIDSNY